MAKKRKKKSHIAFRIIGWIFRQLWALCKYIYSVVRSRPKQHAKVIHIKGLVTKKPQTKEELQDLLKISTVNARYLRATAKHYSALAGTPCKKELKAEYSKLVLRSVSKAEEEESWASNYEHQLSQYGR